MMEKIRMHKGESNSETENDILDRNVNVVYVIKFYLLK